MSTIEEREKEIIEEFAMFDNWMDKYEYIIELGKDLDALPDSQKKDEQLIKGCQSRVWVKTELDGSIVNFKADSDAIITKGIIALLIQVLSGQDASDIIKAELKFIDEIGLKEHLSPTRSNGLLSMVKQMKYESLKLIA
jgi:cysteine desulfuration protein SufE